jgi:asparagine synthase (glutamine-hydrolysing)
MAIQVKGELYESITGQLFELGRQLRQPSGYPFDPRQLQIALQAAIELRRPGWFLDIYKTYAAQGESAQFSSRWYARRVLVIILFQPIIVFLADIFSKIGFPKMKRDLDQFFSGSKPNSNFSRNSVNMTNAFDASLFRQFFCTPLPGILNQYDRCSMAHGVECRMPFMDYRIVEFIFSLPPESKVGNGYTKRILREAMRGLVPDETRLNKSKIGFNAPIVDWFHGPLKDFMLEQMNCEEFLDCKFIDGRVIRSDFEKFLQEDSPNWVDAWRFWPPVHLVWWLKNS